MRRRALPEPTQCGWRGSRVGRKNIIVQTRHRTALRQMDPARGLHGAARNDRPSLLARDRRRSEGANRTGAVVHGYQLTARCPRAILLPCAFPPTTALYQVRNTYTTNIQFTHL